MYLLVLNGSKTTLNIDSLEEILLIVSYAAKSNLKLYNDFERLYGEHE